MVTQSNGRQTNNITAKIKQFNSDSKCDAHETSSHSSTFTFSVHWNQTMSSYMSDDYDSSSRLSRLGRTLVRSLRLTDFRTYYSTWYTAHCSLNVPIDCGSCRNRLAVLGHNHSTRGSELNPFLLQVCPVWRWDQLHLMVNDTLTYNTCCLAIYFASSILWLGFLTTCIYYLWAYFCSHKKCYLTSQWQTECGSATSQSLDTGWPTRRRTSQGLR